MRHIKLSVLRSQIYRPNQKEDPSQYLFTFAAWCSLLIPAEPGAGGTAGEREAAQNLASRTGWVNG
jgi:hypothetical protein